jgi:glycosyltransferase involved in cell wall biosynthesis
VVLDEAMTDKVTVIVPARKEPYINETVRDLFNNAEDEIEVIVVLDGDTPDYKIKRYKGLRILKNLEVEGMRASVDRAAKEATGKYLMKLDAHCTVGPGWDKILKDDCPENCLVVPRRYWFDAPTWSIVDSKPHVDAMSYIYPFVRPYRPRLTARPDKPRELRQQDEDISEEMSFQGSCWFMHKSLFWDYIGGMTDDLYGTFGEEPQQLGLLVQLGPIEGMILRNKKTWYAHWSKPGSHWNAPPEVAGRVPLEELIRVYVNVWDYWWNNRWEGRTHDFDWLVEKFWPIRTWPENWRWLVKQYNRYDLSELWQ